MPLRPAARRRLPSVPVAWSWSKPCGIVRVRLIARRSAQNPPVMPDLRRAQRPEPPELAVAGQDDGRDGRRSCPVALVGPESTDASRGHLTAPLSRPDT